MFFFFLTKDFFFGIWIHYVSNFVHTSLANILINIIKGLFSLKILEFDDIKYELGRSRMIFFVCAK